MCVTPQSPTSPSAGLRTVNRVYEDAASSEKPCHLTYSSSHFSRRSDKLQPTDPTFEAGESGRGLRQGAEEKARCEMPSSWTIAALDTTPPPEPVPSRELWSLSGFMTSALESTWLNLMTFIMFQGIVCLLCVHDGPTVVHRLAEVTPRVLGRRLKRKGESGDSKAGTPAAHADVDPPISVAQSWTLGALYERYVRAREESNLREAGDVLGRARPLTEEEFLSLKRVSERASRRRSRGCCNLADSVYFSGIIGGIWAVASGFRVALDEVFSFVSVPPESLLCLVALAVCLVVVCEGFRAADNVVGGRIALAGVAGATGTLLYSTILQWDREEQVLLTLLLFLLPLLATIAVKLDFALGGFLAVVCAFFGLVVASSALMEATGVGSDIIGVISVVFSSLAVDGLFGLAVFRGAETRDLQLLASGVMATGVCALHLALVFNSVPEWDDIWHRVLIQLPVCAGLITGWALGKAIGSEGLKNNSRLFGALNAAAFIIGLWSRLEDVTEPWFWVGILSLGAWRFGLFLRRHDGFAASLWTLDPDLVRSWLLP